MNLDLFKKVENLFFCINLSATKISFETGLVDYYATKMCTCTVIEREAMFIINKKLRSRYRIEKRHTLVFVAK